MFRPCIDIHEGKVKQIVGGTLDSGSLKTNFVSEKNSAWYAGLFKKDGLLGGHVIMLGKGNEGAAKEALESFKGGLQIGGGISPSNAAFWLDSGASHVIVTSWMFEGKKLSMEKIASLAKIVPKNRLVLDLSCRKREGRYFVATDRWQTVTETELCEETILLLEAYCDEFLIHAADVEGLCRGIDLDLVENLAKWGEKPVTYAGGAKSMDDLRTVQSLGKGRIHLTIGSALDIFGGVGVKYSEALEFNRKYGGQTA